MAKPATKRIPETRPKPGLRNASPPAAASERGGARAKRSAERRDAILAAALEAFSASGFAAARLDDVARRAGVAKGTIYLYFRDKESLFRELVRTALSPLARAITAAARSDLTARELAQLVVDHFVNEIYST